MLCATFLALLTMLLISLTVIKKLRQPLRENRAEQPSAVYRDLSKEILNDHGSEVIEIESQLNRTFEALATAN